MTALENKYREINKFLENKVFQSDNIGLIGGDIGTLLYFLHSFEYDRNNDCLERTVTQIEVYLECTVIESRSPFYCSGIAGMGLFIEFIEQKGWVEIDTNSILNDIDDYLYAKMTNTIETGNYDFFHGAIGIGFYFIYRSRKTEKAKKYLEGLVFQLEKMAVEETDGTLKWEFFQFEKGILIKDEYNLGLAHGIPSILSFLVKVNQEDILSEKTLSMVDKTMRYILKTQVPTSENYSTFPYLVRGEMDLKIPTRLAWCYGDLGVCCSLWNAAKVLQNESLKEKVIKVMLNASKKRGVEQALIEDAGLCHGAAGAAHIFQRFYDWTNVPEFKEAADYWYNVILEMATFEDGYAGFKTHHGEEYGGSRPSANFLDGISGIGLALLYKISGIDPSWEELLFIR